MSEGFLRRRSHVGEGSCAYYRAAATSTSSMTAPISTTRLVVPGHVRVLNVQACDVRDPPSLAWIERDMRTGDVSRGKIKFAH